MHVNTGRVQTTFVYTPTRVHSERVRASVCVQRTHDANRSVKFHYTYIATLRELTPTFLSFSFPLALFFSPSPQRARKKPLLRIRPLLLRDSHLNRVLHHLLYITYRPREFAVHMRDGHARETVVFAPEIIFLSCDDHYTDAQSYVQDRTFAVSSAVYRRIPSRLCDSRVFAVRIDKTVRRKRRNDRRKRSYVRINLLKAIIILSTFSINP